jgi:hypothetical protein
MAAKKILVGCSVRQDPLVFSAYLHALSNQEIPPGYEVDFLFVLDDDNPEPNAALIKERIPEAEVILADERPEQALYGIGQQTHQWNEATFDHLAKQKQKLCNHTVEAEYDYLFLADSDLVVDTRTLKSLIACDKPITSAVYWTQWQKNNPKSLGPNVWLRNPYAQDGMGLEHHEFWRRLVERKVTRVYGGGACHLIKKGVLEKGVKYYPRLPGLPKEGMWQGEDRTFAILAFRYHQHQWADPWPYIWHAYHPEQRSGEILDQALNVLLADPSLFAKEGDWVNFTIQTMEEASLRDQVFPVRGRLGGLTLAPEIEKTLLELPVGESAIIEVSFPLWWPELAGQKRTLRIELLDAKPYGFAPVLADHAFMGVK